MHASKGSSLFIGLGGAGATVLSQPEALQLPRLLLNTDTGDMPPAELFLQLGPKLLKGHCAGGYMFGIKAIDESYGSIVDRIGSATQITIVAGFAGGTGGTAPHLAEKLINDGMQVSLVICMPWFIERAIPEDDTRMIQLDKVKPMLASCKLVSDLEDQNSIPRMRFQDYLDGLNASVLAEIEIP